MQRRQGGMVWRMQRNFSAFSAVVFVVFVIFLRLLAICYSVRTAHLPLALSFWPQTTTHFTYSQKSGEKIKLQVGFRTSLMQFFRLLGHFSLVFGRFAVRCDVSSLCLKCCWQTTWVVVCLLDFKWNAKCVEIQFFTFLLLLLCCKAMRAVVVVVVLAVAEIIQKLPTAAVPCNMQPLLAPDEACQHMQQNFQVHTHICVYVCTYVCIYAWSASLVSSDAPTLHTDRSGQLLLLLCLLAFQHFVWQTLQQQTGWLSVALGADRCVEICARVLSYF